MDYGWYIDQTLRKFPNLIDARFLLLRQGGGRWLTTGATAEARPGTARYADSDAGCEEMGVYQCWSCGTICYRANGRRSWVCLHALRPTTQHATRVLHILGVDDQFAGLTYCDYAEPNFTCKPGETIC